MKKDLKHILPVIIMMSFFQITHAAEQTTVQFLEDEIQISLDHMQRIKQNGCMREKWLGVSTSCSAISLAINEAHTYLEERLKEAKALNNPGRRTPLSIIQGELRLARIEAGVVSKQCPTPDHPEETSKEPDSCILKSGKSKLVAQYLNHRKEILENASPGEKSALGDEIDHALDQLEGPKPLVYYPSISEAQQQMRNTQPEYLPIEPIATPATIAR